MEPRSLTCRVLGSPDGDNAVLVRCDSGHRVTRVLLDCGEGCLDALSEAEIAALDVVAFSHLHLDHAAGFDAVLRRTYSRPSPPLHIVGPAGTARRIQGRYQGYVWNLLEARTPGEVLLTDVGTTIRTVRLRASERFELAGLVTERPASVRVWSSDALILRGCLLDHHIPCLAYAVEERDRTVIDPDRLAASGLAPGPWCAELKDPARPDIGTVEVAGRRLRLGDLRRDLLRTRPGGKISYVTDCRLPEEDRALEELVAGSDVLLAECSFLEADRARAQRHRHLTTTQVADLARRGGVGELVLLHLSNRYGDAEREELLREAQACFPSARLPEGW